MKSAIGLDKLSALVLLAVSTAFGVLAHDLGRVVDRPEGSTAPGRLLLAMALAGSLIAVLMLLSPGKDHRSLASMIKADWLRLSGLGAAVIVYALILHPLGFFLATSLFLVISYLLLGERRWWPLFIASVPVAAVLEILMLGVFGIAVADPLLRALGIIA